LPTPTWEGHSFEGWYTKKTNGDKVTSKTKVTNGNAHTLYAHWKKSGSGNSEQKPDPTPETKTPHKVSFNINGAEGVDTPADITIEEGGTYPALPTLTRTGYKFLGWETEDGTQITEGAPYNATTDQTLKAIWKSNHDWWNEDFETAANDVKADERFIVTVDDGDSSEKGLVEDCKGQLSKDGDVPNYVVVFIKNYSESSAKDKAESVYDKYKEFAPSVKVIVVSDQALKGNDNEKLLYKMMLFDAMYGEGKDHFDDQRTDLDAEGDYPYIYPKND
ncbi:MAG: InlB B-repeat-containing protein, partial [Mogibacterium sp.]|nr:InlB B-repeat-containing protein [Mogibacterium sp.]